ncbi:MAG: hypothetical protein JWO30_122 [Fibrobacteres bacterium]|nr:hypothetical protein [Fibrobacterota bacterium]
MLRFKWLVIGILCGFTAMGGTWVWFKVMRPHAIGRALSAALEDKLRARPAIYLRNYVVVEEKKPIAEFALVSRQTDVERRIESVLLHSKAELTLRAVFNVKAGFDFRAARLDAILDPGLKKARLELSAPKILSLEMIRYEVLVDRSGWWNRISESEKEMAMRDMQADAKLEAIKAGILKDCRQALENEMADIAKRTGVVLEYRYRMAADTLVETPGAGG